MLQIRLTFDTMLLRLRRVSLGIKMDIAKIPLAP